MVTNHRSAEVLASLQESREKIAAERNALEQRLMTLNKELDELAVAARVIARVMGLADGIEAPAMQPEAVGELNKPRGTNGMPTVPDMIKAAIVELTGSAQVATNQNILSIMTHRWGPQDPNIVRPTIWRMWKANRLTKVGEGYQLPTATSTVAGPELPLPETEAAPPQEDAA